MNFNDPTVQAQIASRVRALPDAQLCHIFALANMASMGQAPAQATPAKAPGRPRKAPDAAAATTPAPVDGSTPAPAQAPATPKPGKEVAPLDPNSPEGQAMIAYVRAAGEAGTSRPTIVAAFGQAPPAGAGWEEKRTKAVIAGLQASGALKVVGDKRGAKVMLNG